MYNTIYTAPNLGARQKLEKETDIIVEFTEFTDDETEPRKAVSLDSDGKLVKKSEFKNYVGTSKRKVMAFSDMPEYLKNADKRTHLLTSVTEDDENRMVVPWKKKNEPGSISRSNKYLSWGDNSILGTIDIDSSNDSSLGYRENAIELPYSTKEMADLIRKAIPELSNVPLVISPSSTGFLVVDDEQVTGPRYHIHFPIRSQEDFNYMKDVCTKKLFLSGYGWLHIKADGSTEIRTLIDKTLFSNRTQPIYIHQARIDDTAITTNAPEIKLFSGDEYFVKGDCWTVDDQIQYDAKEKYYLEKSKQKIDAVADIWHAKKEKEEGRYYDADGMPEQSPNRGLPVTSGIHQTIEKTSRKGTFQLNKVPKNQCIEETACIIENSIKSNEEKKEKKDVIHLDMDGDVIFPCGDGTDDANDVVIKDDANKAHLDIGGNVIVSCGIGKTVICAKETARFEGRMAIFLSNYETIKEFVSAYVLERLKEWKSLDLLVIRGQSHFCKKMGTERSIERQIFEIEGSSLCTTCEHGFGGDVSCQMITQYSNKNAINFPKRIYVRNFLVQASRFDEGWVPSMVVCDEDIVPTLTAEGTCLFKVQKADLDEKYHPIFDAIKNGTHDATDISGIVDDSLTEIRVQLTILSKTEQTSDSARLGAARKKRKLKKEKEFCELVKSDSKMWVFPEGKQKIDYLHIVKHKGVAPRYKDIPLLYLDASAVPEVLEACGINTAENTIQLRTPYNKNVKVTQVCDKSFSHSQMKDDPNIWIKLKAYLSGLRGKVLVISYKDFREKFIEIGVDAAKYLWYGNLRGVDVFKNYDHVVVVGRLMLPESAIINKAMVVFDDICTLDDIKTNPNVQKGESKYKQRTQRVIELKNGDNMAVWNYTYIDERLQLVADQLENAELTQAINRLRLIHGEQNKEVHILTNTVCDVVVDKVVTTQELFGGKVETSSKRTEFRQLVDEKRVIQNKNKVIYTGLGWNAQMYDRFKKKNSDWIDDSFKKIKVKVTNQKSRSSELEYFISSGFKGDICQYICENDSNLKKVQMVN